MKKCARCRIVFYLDERSRCLYCDSILMSTNHEEAAELSNLSGIGRFQVANNLIRRILDEWKVENHGRMQFLVSSYFRTRTFGFSYSFSRHDYARGEGYRRFFIQPLNLYSLLMIPWIIYDFFDTIYFRAMYNGYCEKCGWKYVKYQHLQEHSPVECEYNQEYAAVIDNVLSGKITRTEGGFKRLAAEKANTGRRSAYNDLCARKNFSASVMDVACIWISVCIMIFLLVLITFPQLAFIMDKLNGQMDLGGGE